MCLDLRTVLMWIKRGETRTGVTDHDDHDVIGDACSAGVPRYKEIVSSLPKLRKKRLSRFSPLLSLCFNLFLVESGELWFSQIS